MSQRDPRPFSKPEGYDSRIPHPGSDGAVNLESRSFEFVRSRAADLNITVDELLRRDRERLRASTYPGPECLEPYEMERYAAGLLASDRRLHAETCSGCQVLVRGLVPTSIQVSSLLNEVRLTEPEPEALLDQRRVFWLDILAVPAAAGAMILAGYLLWRFGGPIASNPSARAAVLGKLAGWTGGLGVVLWAVCLVALAASMLARRELLMWSRGALASGVVVGLCVALSGWVYLDHTAQTMRTAVILSQVQLTREVVTSCKPYLLSKSNLDLCAVPDEWSSSFVTVAASQNTTNRLLLRSDIKGVPGSVIADIGPSGGLLYWNVEKEKEPIGTILFGTVKSSNGNQFVLSSPDGTTHIIKNQAWASKLVDGSEVSVLLNQKDEAVVSLNPQGPKNSTLQ